MKKQVSILSALVGLLFSSLAAASSASLGTGAPDPRDSVIIESKVIAPGVGSGIAPAARVRVYITNKDSLALFELPLVVWSDSGGAYMTLAWPRTFAGVADALASSLPTRIFSGFRYNSTSPDTLNLVSIFDVNDPASLEPPNPVRKAYYDIKFDSVWAANGTVGIDSVFIIKTTGLRVKNSVAFVDRYGRQIKPNFVKGTVTVQSDVFPCWAQRLDLRENRVLDIADVTLLLNCLFLGKGDCKENFTAADVVILINAIFLAPCRRRPPPVENPERR